MEEKREETNKQTGNIVGGRGETSRLVVGRDELVKLASRSSGVGTMMLKDVIASTYLIGLIEVWF